MSRQHTMEKAHRADGDNVSAALPDEARYATPTQHSTSAAQLQQRLEFLATSVRHYMRLQHHPGQLTTHQLVQEETEVQALARLVADAFSTLDRRRRALASEHTYRINMPASAHLERGSAYLR